jgi:hypothetical protein
VLPYGEAPITGVRQEADIYRAAALTFVLPLILVASAAAEEGRRSPKIDFVPRFQPATADPGYRPAPLGPLYFSFATLQGLDVHSTRLALHRGAAEANPLMKWCAGNPYSLSAVKMLSTAGIIYTAEKMRKKNRKSAVLFMVAANVATVFVVHHNYRVASGRIKRPASLPAPFRSHRGF